MINETQSEIEDRLMQLFITTPPFDSINLSPSATAEFRNYISTIASEIYNLEQLNNIFETEIEGLIARAISATAAWIQDQVFKFQYDATTPQIAQINSDFTIGYPVLDLTMRIVTACAIVASNSGIINIKVAKSSPPVPLSGPELTAFSTYCDLFLPAGAIKNVISVNTDLLRVDAEVFYNGQYSTTIQASVEAALTNYMLNLPFNGIVKASEIEEVILGVAGVTDVVIDRITTTPTSGSPINLILVAQELTRYYQTYSGSIEEDPSFLFATTLTYTVANN